LGTFWLKIEQFWPFEEISIFSNGDHKSSPLKLLSQSQPNFAELILRWSPFKIVSVSAVLYPRWSPLLKIEISSNGQNCSILSQKVPKFELYKHNDVLSKWFQTKRFLWEFPIGSYVKLSSAVAAILVGVLKCWTQIRMRTTQESFQQSWPPLIKIEISSNGQNCSILSQKVPKFELYKHNDELFNFDCNWPSGF
jgi:hypothetical protein